MLSLHYYPIIPIIENIVKPFFDNFTKKFFKQNNNKKRRCNIAFNFYKDKTNCTPELIIISTPKPPATQGEIFLAGFFLRINARIKSPAPISIVTIQAALKNGIKVVIISDKFDKIILNSPIQQYLVLRCLS